MNFKKHPKGAVTKPLLKDLVNRVKADEAARLKPTVGCTPTQPSDLFQDPGAGYNLNFTDPQE